MTTSTDSIREFANQEYKYGFVTDIESDAVPPGVNEDIIRQISAIKKEPEFLLEYRLGAFHQWQKMKEPNWAKVGYTPIDYQNLVYYSAPKPKKQLTSMNEVDPEIRET